MEEIIRKHCDKKYDQFNLAVQQLRDHILLNEDECDELITLINDKLPGECSLIAHHLRRVLCLSIDIIRTEDALITLKGL